MTTETNADIAASAERLAKVLETAPRRLVDISDEEASGRMVEGRWSSKEILGHLIDSAGNNHQRFVRIQMAPQLEFPEYQQESWVRAQAYATEPWSDLVNLWLLFNRHLLHVIRAVPGEALSRICTVGTNPPLPLSALIASYVDHLEHHLESIIGKP